MNSSNIGHNSANPPFTASNNSVEFTKPAMPWLNGQNQGNIYTLSGTSPLPPSQPYQYHNATYPSNWTYNSNSHVINPSSGWPYNQPTYYSSNYHTQAYHPDYSFSTITGNYPNNTYFGNSSENPPQQPPPPSAPNPNTSGMPSEFSNDGKNDKYDRKNFFSLNFWEKIVSSVLYVAGYLRHIAFLITDTVEAIYVFINVSLKIIDNFGTLYGQVFRILLGWLGFNRSRMD